MSDILQTWLKFKEWKHSEEVCHLSEYKTPKPLGRLIHKEMPRNWKSCKLICTVETFWKHHQSMIPSNYL